MTSRRTRSVGGPTGPERPDGPSRVGEVDRAGAVDAVTGIAPAQVAPIAAVEPAGPAAPATAADAVAQIAARLRAGELTVEQAVEALIDDAVRRQVGGATQGRADVEARVREVLKGYAANDPQLAARIRRLGLLKRS